MSPETSVVVAALPVRLRICRVVVLKS